MSKPTAKVAATKKAPVETSKAAPVKKAAAQAAVKAAVPVKAAPKSAPKPAPKAAPKVAVKAAAKPVSKSMTKPAATTPPKPAAKAAAAAKTPAAAPAPSAKSPASAPAKTPTPTTKAAAKSPATAPVPAPQPIPAPLANRFTDRFAPAAKPAPRPMNDTADLPKTAQKIDPKLANAWKTKAGRDLTNEELQAMPEAEYMNEKQLDFFRSKLQQQKDDLLSSAGETTEHLREDTSIVPDPVDRATIEEEHALELRTRDRERKLLKKIAQSLGRIETAEYGYCDETGEPIGLARLIARPTATLSLEAQQRREMKQKMFGD